MDKKVAIFTGANRGIGLEIARQLGKLGVTVILTTRKKEQGQAACDNLKQEGLNVHFRELDVTEESSIHELADDMKEQFGVIDVLINNAGIFIDDDQGILEMSVDTLRKIMETNLYGPLRLAQALVSLLRNSNSGRIVNISSGMGALNGMGGGDPAYSISKAAINALTIKLAAELRSSGIAVNSMCPGWVRTDMGGPSAPRSVEQGADTAVWLATGEVGATGKFFRDRVVISW